MRPSRPEFDDLLDEADRRDAAVVVADEVRDTRRLDRRHHFLALGGGAGERLFGDDHLAGLGGGDGDVVVQVVGHADVDQVDVRPGDQRPPVGLDALVAPAAGEVAHLGLVAAAGGLEHRAAGEVEEVRRGAEGVGMGSGP